MDVNYSTMELHRICGPRSDASTVAGEFPLPDSYESFTASRLLSATKPKNGIRKRCSCYLKSIINYVIMY